MPWGAKDAKRHTKKAASDAAQAQWADVANSVLQSSGDEGRAVREANAVVKQRGAHLFKGKKKK